jgi:putative two-component system response regulator
MKTDMDLCTDCNVMVVDDQPRNLRLFERLMQGKGFRIQVFTNGIQALSAAERKPPDLVVLDINMPVLDGWEVNARLKQTPTLSEIPVLFLSGISDAHSKARAFASGGVDYITKPFQSEEVLARIETHLRLHGLKRQLAMHNRRLEERVKEQVAEISNSQRATITALAKLAESRDDDTGQHITRVQEFCRALALHLQDNSPYSHLISEAFIDDIYHASALHDVGKVGTPDAILLKPGKLTNEEFDIMKTHSIIGHETLLKVSQAHPGNSMIEMGALIARHHHEKWDGRGYPDGLAGENIPLPARIMAIADIYDALGSKRPYKDPMPHEKCCAIIEEGRGTHLDPIVVDGFLTIKEEFLRLREILS